MENRIEALAYSACVKKNLFYHSWEHTLRVADYAKSILANEFGDASILTDVLVASYFHDTGRIRDRVDCEHGYRSAMILDLHELPFSHDKGSVRFAILNHCRKQGELGHLPVTKNYSPRGSIDMRIAACLWDADRLDLIRLPNFPYVKMDCLSTEYAKSFANSPEHKKLYEKQV